MQPRKFCKIKGRVAGKLWKWVGMLAVLDLDTLTNDSGIKHLLNFPEFNCDALSV